MLGGMTFGNATLVAIDGGPVLATDPWLGDVDPAYFGSWTLSHQITAEQRELLSTAPYHWYSHGHPDHLNPVSLRRFADKQILLPDHVGSRIQEGLTTAGMHVTVLPERRWFELTPRVRVMCISDHIQDAILLVDVGGVLFVDVNDAGVRGCRRFVRSVVEGFDDSYLLKISGYGDADMINIFDERGERVEPFGDTRPVVGAQLSGWARTLGCNHVIPFSSFHRYQRTDSAWAGAYTTPIEAYGGGFDHTVADFVDPFATIDAVRGLVGSAEPARTASELRPPEDFGDDWSQDLEADDRAALDRYFTRIHGVRTAYGFLDFEVGATRHVVRLDGPTKRGITFAVPRTSLMSAIDHQIFDDLLIGNFMKTTFHNARSLYDPDFTFAVAKYSDNGRASSEEEVKAYLNQYAARAEGEWLREQLDAQVRRLAARYLSGESGPVRAGRSVYRTLR